MWIILPIKDLNKSKSLLQKVLTPEQQEGLLLSIAEDMLSVLTACVSVEGVVVVGNHPDVKSLANRYGVKVLSFDEDTDLDSYIQGAINWLLDQKISRYMVLRGDLPLISSTEIEKLISASDGSDLTLVGCNQDQDINAFIATLPSITPFIYGEKSLDSYRQSANEAGLNIQIEKSPTLTLKVDTDKDLFKLCQFYRSPGRLKGSHTFKFVEKLSLLHDTRYIVGRVGGGLIPSDDKARSLAVEPDAMKLVNAAAELRDRGHGNVISYSRKVFIPLTRLCRDVCHYCTFATAPKQVAAPYMSVDEVLDVARQGAAMGCKEALITLGEKPELRYRAAREALDELGFESTLEYVAYIAKAIYENTGLLPHVNAGCMNAAEISMLREYSPSMGLMLESASERLCQKGMPHFGSPDKHPSHRLETIALAGEARVPFTSGILIGIGETRLERIESLLALRRLHTRYGHLQEIIIQNFRAKPGTRMANAPEPDQDDLCWTIAVARIIFGAEMNIQAPPNLVPEVLEPVLESGINDLGGISPLTPDFVNPEAPWPHLDKLSRQVASMGRQLQQRLTLYPAYARAGDRWLGSKVLPGALRLMDGQGFAREDEWLSGVSESVPGELGEQVLNPLVPVRPELPVITLLRRCRIEGSESLSEADIVRLFEARGDEFTAICRAADKLREEVKGNRVTYVVNRNINYTNICYFKCKFCAFSKGKASEGLRDAPYNLGLEEIQRRTIDAKMMGVTEVCLQGGIHPDYSGNTYLDICRAIKDVAPDMHIHAFSPLEVWQGAETLGVPLTDYLLQLRNAGLGSLPGTAAEILHDEVREKLCANKVNTEQWVSVMETAHRVGLNSTATIMFGHIEKYKHWAHHLLTIRSLQKRTGGFTEFVPLPFVSHEAPIYRQGQSRRGPTLREAVLMHAVSRLILHPFITNIQASWVKMGSEGVQLCLQAGANDIGGTLIDESITRAAGANHGQRMPVEQLESIISVNSRIPSQRTTLYKPHKAACYHNPANIIAIQ